MTIEQQISTALQGDKKALNEVLKSIRQYVYNISIRFLWHPQDAEDATQEILIKVCTNLSQFKGSSAFTTWAYRIAVNHLLNVKRSRVESMNIDFVRFAEDLKLNYDAGGYEAPDSYLLEEEVKIGCTTAMLSCLTRELRIVYIIGEIFETKSNVASKILNISPAAFRKQLQKARELIRTFMTDNCGVANTANRCRCNNMISCAIRRGTVKKDQLLFACESRVQKSRNEMEQLHEIGDIFRNHPQYKSPDRLERYIDEMLNSNRFEVLS